MTAVKPEPVFIQEPDEESVIDPEQTIVLMIKSLENTDS
jgi:hypothetical protein